MKVVILAAGYGTRLYPYTKNFPKPLLDVKGRPIIEYLLHKLERRSDVSKVIVVTNSRFYKHFVYWKKSVRTRLVLEIVNDLSKSPKDKLGAIKDMELVFKKEGYKGDFLVLGGDNFFKGWLDGFIRFAQRKSPGITIGAVDIGDKKQARHYGVLRMGKTKRIFEFQEKPEAPKSTLVAMCLYYFPSVKVPLVKRYLADPGNYRDAVGAYIKWLIAHDEVFGFRFRSLWFDIGRVDTYITLNRLLSKLSSPESGVSNPIP